MDDHTELKEIKSDTSWPTSLVADTPVDTSTETPVDTTVDSTVDTSTATLTATPTSTVNPSSPSNSSGSFATLTQHVASAVDDFGPAWSYLRSEVFGNLMVPSVMGDVYTVVKEVCGGRAGDRGVDR